ncbi:MAG: hypothetical protein M1829_000985 [Trizodia sp. TS-e1964]|nr:MAG: hypothetical protein M1829_000985 [Trizodia sp. TS-e1964]
MLAPSGLAFVALVVFAFAAHSSHLSPPVLPLIVRNPYLSTWLPDARGAPWQKWPTFWTGQMMGFSVLAAVPQTHTVYPLLGRAHDSLLPLRRGDGYSVSFPEYQGVRYDASTTNLSYEIPNPLPYSLSAESVKIVLSFLSPITPTSTMRQSIPASYLSVHVEGDFDIDIYVDINGQWVSGNRGSVINWEFAHLQKEGEQGENILKTWIVKREIEELLSEYRDRSEWGSLHFSAPLDVRHECGTSAQLRQRFSRTGTLENTIDGSFRDIMDKEPVFAFSKSFKLGSNSSATHDQVLFTIAHIQDPVAQFASARGLTYMRPLWKSWFPTEEALIAFHYFDFENASNLANNYSAQVTADALRSGSKDFADILALAARQVMGATSFSGTAENPLLFIKEISSDGNFQTVDVIYPAFPFFLYTNPRWLAYLLEPLLEHMLSGQYPNQYSMHDLGSHFPNATGHPDGNDEYMPVEECGNMLIMGLAIVNSLKYDTPNAGGSFWASLGSEDATTSSNVSIFALRNREPRDGMFGLDHHWGSTSEDGENSGERQARKWVSKSYTLWKQWTRYLVEFSLIPANQLSTDDFAGWLANHTNLALKGVIGIKAMSEIASIMGNEADKKYYQNISSTYISKWEEYAVSRDGTHVKLAYTWQGSWTTIYNLFADSLLCFHISNLTTPDIAPSHDEYPLILGQKLGSNHNAKNGFVSNRIYKIQSDWYHNVRQRYGLPLDSRHLYTKSDWEFFATAVTSKNVREEVVQSVALWVNETNTDRPMTDLYDTEGTGGFPDIYFMARPVVGGHFAFLALERACDGKALEGLDFLNNEDDLLLVEVPSVKESHKHPEL